MFKYFKARRAEKQSAYLLYQKLVEQARSVPFYKDYGVLDTIEGRFDMILLHLFLVDARLKSEEDASGDETCLGLRRHLQEAMVSDLDRSFREMGIGDMSVGKEMKKVGSAWLGRQDAYAAALEDGAEADKLEQALANNLYDGVENPPLAYMAAYIRQAHTQLENTVLASVTGCDFSFPDPSQIDQNQPVMAQKGNL
ncbi:MAG: hypothetical protein JKY34_10260 [Kordiimonadaceae bacterium]|nr:hypothetical protein [Kordiimonadaceae bacterium]